MIKLDKKEIKNLFEGENPFNSLIPEPTWATIPLTKEYAKAYAFSDPRGEIGELPVQPDPNKEFDCSKFASTGRQDDRWYDWRCTNWGTKWGACEVKITEEDLDFHLGEVTQVFLKPGDGNVRGGTDSQALHLQPLDSSLPTMGRQIIARPLIRGISESVTKGDLVIFTLIFKKAFYIGPVNSFNSPADGSNPTFTRKRLGSFIRTRQKNYGTIQ